MPSFHSTLANVIAAALIQWDQEDRSRFPRPRPPVAAEMEEYYCKANYIVEALEARLR